MGKATDSRQRRDTWLYVFQLLLQLGPDPVLQLRILPKSLQRGLDLAIWDILPMSLFPSAGTESKCTRSDLSLAGQYPDKEIDKGARILPMELAVAESRKWSH